MSDHILPLNRRHLLAGLGALALAPPIASARADGVRSLALRARPDQLSLREGEAATPVWSLGETSLVCKRGDNAEIAFNNDLPIPVALNWRGLDGVAALEPLLGMPALGAGTSTSLRVPLRHAGTYLCDATLLGDGAAWPSRVLPLVVSEREPVAVDRDEVFLIEGWRLKPDGSAIAPGSDASGTTAAYTVNGTLARDIRVRGRERLRLRFINGLQRHVIALKLEHQDVLMMALDGQPAEPFLARNGAFALAPGGRADVFIDAAPGAGTSDILMHDGESARPIGKLVISDEPAIRAEMRPTASALPSNGLPPRIDLKTALRVDIPIGGDHANWIAPATFTASTPPVFRVKTGRAVVLSLTNNAQSTSVFHLHGHHVRLLDRLDDGWKPFWLDTLAIDAGQTQRVAFLAEYPGRWLMEAVEADWKAPRLLRWFSVD